MYDYNRIGPWPLINVDKSVNFIGVVTANNGGININPVLVSATPNTFVACNRFRGTGQTIGVGDHISIGIAMAGDFDNQEQPIQYGFNWYSFTSNALLCKRPFVGRADSAALVTTIAGGQNLVSNPYFLPQDLGVNGVNLYSSGNLSTVIGEVDVDEQDNDRPIIFGMSYYNQTGASIGFNFDLSMSVQKCIATVKTHEGRR